MSIFTFWDWCRQNTQPFEVNSSQCKKNNNKNPACHRVPQSVDDKFPKSHTGVEHFPGQFPQTYSLTFTTHPSRSVDCPGVNGHPLLTQWQDFCCIKSCRSHYMVLFLCVNEYNVTKQCSSLQQANEKFRSKTHRFNPEQQCWDAATARRLLLSSTTLYTQLTVWHKARLVGQAASILQRCSNSFTHSFTPSIIWNHSRSTAARQTQHRNTDYTYNTGSVSHSGSYVNNIAAVTSLHHSVLSATSQPDSIFVGRIQLQHIRRIPTFNLFTVFSGGGRDEWAISYHEKMYRSVSRLIFNSVTPEYVL